MPKPSDLNYHGKQFEKLIDKAFCVLDKQFPITWERIIDSAAAGNIVAATEGDFRMKIASNYAGRPYSFVIECKASNVENTFNRCFRSLIKKGQFPLMRMSVRAGAIGLFLFYSVQNEEMEVWDFNQLKKPYYEKRKPFDGQPRYIVAKPNIETFALNLVRHPAQFLDRVLNVR